MPVINLADPFTLVLVAALAAGLVSGLMVGVLMRWRFGIRFQAQNREVEGLKQIERDLEKRNASLLSEVEHGRSSIEQLRAEIANLRTESQILNRTEAELRTQLQENRKAFAEKEALFASSSEALKKEFQLLSARIFEHQGATFRDQNKNQLNDVLKPFREQISEFKRRVDEVYVAESKDRASLLNEVRNLQKASDRINMEASNLTKALKGDKRIQGNWGEMVLETVLQGSGLRKGHEYSTQISMRNAEGDLKRPDVVIHLPDEKDIVVDAKVSLNAYEQALAAEEEGERREHIKQHLYHLREQIKRLSEQNYGELKGVRSLDFVLLFLPIEPAFTLAMEEDPSLFTEAFKQRIMIVSPTTLMMTLRIIHNIWRYEKQSKNAQKIARRAGAIYDKLRVALEDLDSLGNTLKSAERYYDMSMNKLASGRGNLVNQVEKLRELGASVRKPMPRKVLEQADADLSLEDADQPATEPQPEQDATPENGDSAS